MVSSSTLALGLVRTCRPVKPGQRCLLHPTDEHPRPTAGTEPASPASCDEILTPGTDDGKFKNPFQNLAWPPVHTLSRSIAWEHGRVLPGSSFQSRSCGCRVIFNPLSTLADAGFGRRFLQCHNARLSLETSRGDCWRDG